MTDRRFYAIFGATVACDRKLPFRETDAQTADLEVCRRRKLAEEIDAESELGVLRGDPLRVAFGRGDWLFSLEPARARIAYCEVDWGHLEPPFAHFLEREMLPLCRALQGEGRVALHAGGIALDEQGWLFVGDKGVGKSTTVYEFVRRAGAHAMSDEMALVDLDEAEILPGRPALRLDRPAGGLPEAVADGAVHETIDKRWFRLAPDCYADDAAELTGVVVLRSGGERGRLRELSGKDALAAVLDQMYDFEESPRSWRRRRFRDARRLAERIPIHEVWRGPDGEGGDPTDLIPDV